MTVVVDRPTMTAEHPSASSPEARAFDDIDDFHMALGEFLVSFQFIEQFYRQIGWLLSDPARLTWPPVTFRKGTNQQLIDGVTDLYLSVVESQGLPNGAPMVARIASMRDRSHALRKTRNILVHAAYIEMKAGREVVGYLGPRLVVDPDTGDLTEVLEPMLAADIRRELVPAAEIAYALNLIHIQLINWLPYLTGDAQVDKAEWDPKRY